MFFLNSGTFEISFLQLISTIWLQVKPYNILDDFEKQEIECLGADVNVRLCCCDCEQRLVRREFDVNCML